MFKGKNIDLIKDYKNKQSINPTKANKLRELKRLISKTSKYSNPAYLNAIERNKKKSRYNHMILKLQATISPSEQEKIINEYILNKD